MKNTDNHTPVFDLSLIINNKKFYKNTKLNTGLKIIFEY